MAKRKGKVRQKDPGNVSDEESSSSAQVKKCQHVKISVCLRELKKASKTNPEIGKCTNCSIADVSKRVITSDSSAGTGAPADNDNIDAPAIYLCLRCLHQGCDRSSEKKHALQHYETDHSDHHDLVVNLTTWQVWCYVCDDFIDVSSDKMLEDGVEFVHKLAKISPVISINVSASKEAQKPVENKYNASKESSAAASGISENLNKKKATATVINAASDISAKYPRVKGLANLGNTCFFNAVSQNLCQTYLFESQLRAFAVKGKVIECTPSSVDTKDDDDHLCEKVVEHSEDEGRVKKELVHPGALAVNLGEVGEMARSLVQFFDEMSSRTESNKQTCVSPSQLFGQVCKKAPRFKGFQQQDSHELLHYLLDGIKSEEVKRSRAGILKIFNLSDSTKPKDIPEEDKAKIKAYSHVTKHTFVDSVFGGYFINTVTCETCKTHHQIFEPFLDISLPIIDEKASKLSLNFGGKKSDDKKNMSVNAAAEPDSQDLNTTAPKQSKNMTKKQQKAQRKQNKNKKWKALPNNKVPEESVLISNGDEIIADDGAEKHDEDKKHFPDKKVNDQEKGSLENGVMSAEFNSSNVEDDDDNVIFRENGYSSSGTPAERASSATGSKVSTPGSSSSDADVEDNTESDASKINSARDTNIDHHNNRHIDTATGYNDNALRNDKTQLVGDHDDDKTGVDKIIQQTSDLSLHDGKDIADIGTMTTEISLENSATIDSGTIWNNETAISSNDVSLNASMASFDRSSLFNTSATDLCSALVVEREAIRNRNAVDAGVSRSQWERECNEARKAATGTVVTRPRPASEDRSITSCLHQFTAQEMLSGNNMFICSACNSKKGEKAAPIKTIASKQMLIFSPPAVLTLHLKRFQQVGFNLRKDSRHVQFSEILDLAPYCSALCQNINIGQKQIMYSLYGIVEHGGTLRGGHYTAYVKVRQPNPSAVKFIQNMSAGELTIERLVNSMHAMQRHLDTVTIPPCDSQLGDFTVPGKWFYVSDSHVSEVSNLSNVFNCQAYLLFYDRVL